MTTFNSTGPGSSVVTIEGLTSPQTDNVTLVDAGTEYAIVLPASTQRYLLRARDPGSLHHSYISSGNYLTIPSGVWLSEDQISVSPLTIYVTSPAVAGQTLELVTWS